MTLALVFLTSIFEGLSLGLVIPMLEAIGGGPGQSGFAQLTGRLLESVGLRQTFLTLMLVFVVLSLFKHAFTAFADYQARVLSSSVKYSMRRRVFENLMLVPLAYYYHRSVGSLVSGAYTSTDEAAALAENGVRLVTALLLTGVYLALQFAISPWLTILAVGCVGASYYFIVPRFTLSYSQGEEAKSLIDRSVAFLQNRLSGIKTIKAFGNEHVHEQEYDALIGGLRKVAVSIQKNKIVANLFGEPFTTIVVVGLLIVAVQVLRLGVTELVAFFYAYSMLVPRIKAINAEYLTIAEKLPHFEQVHELSRQDDKVYLPRGSVAISHIDDDIEFRDVVFRYPQTEAVVLKGVTFRITRQHTTAIVGASGAGKTTVIDLLLRLHDPTGGAVVVNSRPLFDYRIEDWHRLVGVVEQDAYLFHDSVGNNIRYGKLDATDEEVRRAARLAHADLFIEALPHRYDTVIGERGITLSGGQRQRLALARALVRDPQLLILDEATSALDSESERLIQDALAGLRKNRTVVIIAHRLSTILNADRIVILEHGTAVEQGTHEQLLTRRGLYHRYYSLQTEH